MGCCYSAAQSMAGDKPPEPSRWKPLEKRSCTDIIPLAIFFIFFIGMILIAAFAIANGAAYRMINGFDSYGNVCGKQNKPVTNHHLSGLDNREKSYVFFMDVLDARTSLEICVSKCPDRELRTMNDVYNFYLETGSQLCDYSYPPDRYLSAAVADQSTTGPCPVLPVKISSAILFRCVPDNIGTFIADLVTMINNLDPISRIVSDIYACRYAIIGLCFLSLLVAFLVVLLLRYMASMVVYIINIVVALSSLAGTAVLWWMYASSRIALEKKAPETKLKSEQENTQAFLWYSIGATIITFVLLLLILVMRKRVALTVDLFYEAGKCMQHMPTLLLQPLWTFFVLVFFWIGWVVVFGFIAFSGAFIKPMMVKGFFLHFRLLIKIQCQFSYMWWYHIVGLIWVSEFILACQQIVIAGAVAKHYFTRDKKNLGSPIISAMGRLISNHLGSCALGSFIIVLVKIPRCILMFLSRQIKDSPNLLAKFMVKCCMCCLWVLEKCLRYLNYNAYSLVAINGTHFCKSACDAVATLLSNALRVIAINSIGAFVLFLGKLLVVAIVAGIGGLLVIKFHPNVHHMAAPVGLIAVFSYLTAHCFISTYEMAIDTLLLCFCEDCRVNDGSPGKEYFMPKSLM
uniref:Choline transporter-like protein n=1 Tax=Ciona savignyi TaxID=51511 RepID=H2Z454_CIOSA